MMRNIEALYQPFISQDPFSSFGLVLDGAAKKILGSRVQRLSQLAPNLVQRVCTEEPGPREEVLSLVKPLLGFEVQWFSPWEVIQFLKQWFLTQTGSIRIWSVGCDQGQEPYSISCAFSEIENGFRARRPDLSIVATDVSAVCLDRAKQGIYTRDELQKGVSWIRKRKFFEKVDYHLYQLNSREQERVSFSFQHILKGFHDLDDFDVILCDQFLPYFSRPLRYALICRLVDRLKPNGYLFLGEARFDLEKFANLKPIFIENRILYQKR